MFFGTKTGSVSPAAQRVKEVREAAAKTCRQKAREWRLAMLKKAAGRVKRQDPVVVKATVVCEVPMVYDVPMAFEDAVAFEVPVVYDVPTVSEVPVVVRDTTLAEEAVVFEDPEMVDVPPQGATLRSLRREYRQIKNKFEKLSARDDAKSDPTIRSSIKKLRYRLKNHQKRLGISQTEPVSEPNATAQPDVESIADESPFHSSMNVDAEPFFPSTAQTPVEHRTVTPSTTDNLATVADDDTTVDDGSPDEPLPPLHGKSRRNLKTRIRTFKRQIEKLSARDDAESSPEIRAKLSHLRRQLRNHETRLNGR